ncbi:hypothetical protein [Alicyclobacillus sendaiensis]|uniref:hypothetical protein n=1 Tax=Alicyclobacillus sendaiensis TaxID=192387 RepID=UPI000A5D3BFB|nr:hypothetical protein [Alicyclobacillus sendaiensis]
MNRKLMGIPLSVALLIFTVTGCSTSEQVHHHANGLSAASGSKASSPVTIAEAELKPHGAISVSASATLAVNRENQTLTVSVDAVHLAPNHRYAVFLVTDSDVSNKSQKLLGALKADEHGEATFMTIVKQISSIPATGWNLKLVEGGHVLASGPVHILVMNTKHATGLANG